MRFPKQLGILALSATLGACGIIKDRSGEYSAAAEGATLKIPPHLSADTIQPMYPIPEATNRNVLIKQGYKLPPPPDATAVLDEAPFRIETEASEGSTWLHLFTAPGRVWPMLDAFWRQLGMRVEYEEISRGFVVTQPIQMLHSQPELSLPEGLSAALQGKRLQAQLRQGVRRNTTELQLRVLDATESPRQWREAAGNAVVEQQLLSVMGAFMTSDAQQNRHSLLANDIGGQSLVRLLRDAQEQHYLAMQLSFARAWSEVGEALEAAGVVVADLDRSEQVYLISALSEDDLSRWYEFFANEAERRKAHNFALRLSVDAQGLVLAKVELLDPDIDPEQGDELLRRVFEYIQ